MHRAAVLLGLVNTAFRLQNNTALMLSWLSNITGTLGKAAEEMKSSSSLSWGALWSASCAQQGWVCLIRTLLGEGPEKGLETQCDVRVPPLLLSSGGPEKGSGARSCPGCCLVRRFVSVSTNKMQTSRSNSLLWWWRPPACTCCWSSADEWALLPRAGFYGHYLIYQHFLLWHNFQPQQKSSFLIRLIPRGWTDAFFHCGCHDTVQGLREKQGWKGAADLE